MRVQEAKPKPTLGFWTPDVPITADPGQGPRPDLMPRATYVRYRTGNYGYSRAAQVTQRPKPTLPLIGVRTRHGYVNQVSEWWSGAGSNRRPSAFQV
jgi:hypothetical protein